MIEHDIKDNDELLDVVTIQVDSGQEPLRIDKFLTMRLAKTSRNWIQNALAGGSITVNGNHIKASYKVKPFDSVKVIVPVFGDQNTEVKPQDIPLNIEYEDEHLLVVNKPCGMVVHPGISNTDGTLVNALAFHLKDSELPVMPNNQRDRPGLVHRLDKDTSGLLVIAKTDAAMTHLAKQFFDHTVERSYRSIVWGSFDTPYGTINERIGRDRSDRTAMRVYQDGENSKEAITHYEVLEDFYYVSLIACTLETGRTHQIRVHMSHKNHPVFNDSKYGGSRIVKGTVYTRYRQFVENCFKLCPRQALHAYSLGFVHPATGEFIKFEAPLPEDMSNLLDKWRAYFKTKEKGNEL